MFGFAPPPPSSTRGPFFFFCSLLASCGTAVEPLPRFFLRLLLSLSPQAPMLLCTFPKHCLSSSSTRLLCSWADVEAVFKFFFSSSGPSGYRQQIRRLLYQFVFSFLTFLETFAMRHSCLSSVDLLHGIFLYHGGHSDYQSDFVCANISGWSKENPVTVLNYLLVFFVSSNTLFATKDRRYERAEQSRAEQSRAEQSRRAEQNRAWCMWCSRCVYCAAFKGVCLCVCLFVFKDVWVTFCGCVGVLLCVCCVVWCSCSWCVSGRTHTPPPPPPPPPTPPPTHPPTHSHIPRAPVDSTCDLTAQWISCHFTSATVRFSHFLWRLLGCDSGDQCRQYQSQCRSSLCSLFRRWNCSWCCFRVNLA